MKDPEKLREFCFYSTLSTFITENFSSFFRIMYVLVFFFVFFFNLRAEKNRLTQLSLHKCNESFTFLFLHLCVCVISFYVTFL